MDDHSKDARLRRLASRLELDPLFVAHALWGWATSRGLGTDAEIAAAIGCDLDTLVKLRLCRRPPTDERVKRLAGQIGIDETKLREILR